jgi:hypothetical protein
MPENERTPHTGDLSWEPNSSMKDNLEIKEKNGQPG